jgi:para-aminobenzoate synthetase component 1
VPSTPSFLDHGSAIRRDPLPDWVDPADAFAELYATNPYTVWLDAGAGATAGVSYLAGAHERSFVVTASATTGTVTRSRPLDPADVPVTAAGDVLDVLRAELPPGSGGSNQVDEIAFRLGWIGWLGYGLAGSAEPGHSDQTDAPDAALLQVDRAIVFDHASHTVTLLTRPGPATPAGDSAERGWVTDTRRRLAGIGRRSGSAAPAATPPGCATAAPGPDVPTVRWRHDATEYARLIALCQERITAGDAYQLCLTNEVTVAGRFDAVEVYGRLRASSPSHHGGLLRFGEHALLSASPEEFLSVSAGGRIRTRPIKGTRPRSDDPTRDRMLRAELLASDKERAENLMIVDLMRNDLGRAAALGSVAVTGLLEVESYPHVHQLVSTVEARLAPGLSAIDAVISAFPAGSMTGAPKPSAMRILAALENGRRGVYAGAFGYFGEDGTVDLAMVIRSIVLGPAGASIGTGGGITALSVAHEEIEETRIKAAALIGAILACSPAPERAGGQIE